MITLTTSELVIVRLTMDPHKWNMLTNWEQTTVGRRAFEYTNHKFLGLAVEQFERNAPLCDTSAYGIDTDFGPVVGVYTYENKPRPHNAMNYKLGFNNGKLSIRVMGFHTPEEREKFLQPDYPFQVSEMFF